MTIAEMQTWARDNEKWLSKERKEELETQYGIDEIVNGPVWPNHCDHEMEAYVCSFKCHTYHGNNSRESIFDLYVFEHKWYGQEICLRDGPDGRDYCSPGNVTDFICRYRFSTRHNDFHTAAAIILVHLGILKWERFERK